jgi:Tol biopolymer transport system component
LPTPASGNAGSTAHAVGDDGRHVLFSSTAGDLVSGDDNRLPDVFVRDLEAGTTTLVSGNAARTGGGNGGSSGVAMSHGGRYVLFDSYAGDLVADGIDRDSDNDVYLRDTRTSVTQLVSVNLEGFSTAGFSWATAITPSGRYVLFSSLASDLTMEDGNGLTDVFLRDVQAGVTELVSVNAAGNRSADGLSRGSAVTPNGRFVLFVSEAGDLVSMPTGNWQQVYVRDRQTGTTRLVSVNAAGTAAAIGQSFEPAITPDGRYVVFNSTAFDLVAGDFNNAIDVFVRDLTAGTTTLVSRNASGTGSGNDSSVAGGLSADGRYVLFASDASDLVSNDGNGRTDLFRRDLQTGSTVLVSVDAAGTGSGNGRSGAGTMSADGLTVAFSSEASNLVAGDANGWNDVFVRDLATGTTLLMSANAVGAPANGAAVPALVAANGTRVAFDSWASDLVANDFNNLTDVFAAATGRTPATLPFADGFEPGDLTAWASYQP